MSDMSTGSIHSPWLEHEAGVFDGQFDLVVSWVTWAQVVSTVHD